MATSSNIQVSICCVTYNHGKLIRQCLDGFVMQQTDFSFEILVHEDASTDDTAKILKEYETKYPSLFRCVYQTINQFAIQNTLINILFPMAKGKYIAMCEGDDYWTDPFKLQKQVDFLEANPEYSICAHNVLVNTEQADGEILNQVAWAGKEHRNTSTIRDLLMYGSGGATCSLVFLKKCISPVHEVFKNLPASDIAIQIICAQHGDLYYMEEVMGVYRRHSTGVTSVWSTVKIFKEYGVERSKKINNYFNGKYQYEIDYLLFHYYYPNLLAAYKQSGKKLHYFFYACKEKILQLKYGFKSN